ncbi:NAD-dependent protein deacetylase sirtuin-2 [Mortierella alpina]|uniref:NAD-dependent protein deacetylase sirtuin-2 n=1 Tax=Mortierella alpina TaxID=64518 RepID=A0A9P6J4F7_MORAP|nr:NAD-dependent protein deacetylase sirtuin-2 [Mortierella alpina]
MTSAAAVRIPVKERLPKPMPEPEPRIQIVKDASIDAIAHLINAQKAKNIIVMTGAGISTAAGIKDFRSPGTGLYADLEEYNLPFPEAVFDLEFFKPTLTHYLLPLLAKKKLLLRSYTQNIDSLERLAGLDEDFLVEAHGSFTNAKCIQCEMTSDSAWVKKHIMDGDIPYCQRCSGLVKPGITFFGEGLPLRFTKMVETDFESCDLLIVLGTSLKVEPFNKLIAKVSPRCPRLLINRERAGEELHSGFDFDDKQKYTIQRDALFLGSCDEGVKKLAALCGWEDELQNMYDDGHAQMKATDMKAQSGSGALDFVNEEEDADADSDDLQEDDLETAEGKTNLCTNDSDLLFGEITQRLEKSSLLSQSEEPRQPLEPALCSTESSNDGRDTEAALKVNGESESAQLLAETSGLSSAPEEPSSSGEQVVDTIAVKVEEDTLTLPLDRAADETTANGSATTFPHQGLTTDDSAASSSPSTELAPTAVKNGDFAETGSRAPPANSCSGAEVLADAKIFAEKNLQQSVAPASSPQTPGLDSSVSSLSSGSSVSPFEPSAAFINSVPHAATTRESTEVLITCVAPVTAVASVEPSVSPESVAVSTASTFQPVSRCIPVGDIDANTGTEVAAVGSHTYHPFGSDMSFNFSGGDGETSGRGLGAKDGLFFQMIRRKRRKDFENAAYGGSMKSGEFRYLRGHGTVHPHYLTCGRVSKRPRFA